MAPLTSRKRNAAATRQAILDAARQTFTEKGFDGAGVRQIADCSGVNASLICRYFGSKEALFAEAILPEVNMDNLLEGDRATFGVRAAEHAATKCYESPDLDPTAAILLSISNDSVCPAMKEALQKRVIKKLAVWLGGKNAEGRAALIVAHLFGFDVLRREIGLDQLSPEQLQPVRRLFAAAIQSYVDDCE